MRGWSGGNCLEPAALALRVGVLHLRQPPVERLRQRRHLVRGRHLGHTDTKECGYVGLQRGYMGLQPRVRAEGHGLGVKGGGARLDSEARLEGWIHHL